MATRKRGRKSRPDRPSMGELGRDRSQARAENVSRFVTKSWAVTAQVLSQRRDRLAICDLMGFFYWLSDQNMERIKRGLPAIPCAIGCSYCCYVRAGLPDLLPLEAFRIAEFLRGSGQASTAQVQARLARPEAVQQQVAQGAKDEKGRYPCSFLAQEQCLIYPVRPLRCRAQYSPDVEACRQNYLGQRDTIPLLDAPALLYESLRVGIRLGLEQVWLHSPRLALQSAISIALREPDALERWFDGKPVFEDARLPEQAEDKRFVKRLAAQCRSQVRVEETRLQRVIRTFLEEPGEWNQRVPSGASAQL